MDTPKLDDVIEVEVWWGRTGAERPWHRELLTEPEQERRAKYWRAEDQARFTVATAVLKLAAGQRLGLPAGQIRLDRSCDCGRPHGRPRLPGTGLAASISHAGDWVAVALTDSVPVGVDVEQIQHIEISQVAGHVLGEEETPASLSEFFCYWTRKEAAVKATGDGMKMPLPKVVVSPPGAPAELLRYGDRTDLVASMSDLDIDDGYAAAVAVLGRGPLRLLERDAAELLAG